MIGPVIPDIQGIQDPQVSRILVPMKQLIDQMAGHRVKQGQIKPLGPTANLDGVIYKINEVLGFLQDQKQLGSPPAVRTGKAWNAVDASGAGLALSQVIEGQYFKLERMVFAFFAIAYPVTADATSALVGGLPYVARTNGAVLISLQNVAAGFAADIVAGTQSFRLAVTGTLQTNANVSGKSIRGCAIYLTDDT